MSFRTALYCDNPDCTAMVEITAGVDARVNPNHTPGSTFIQSPLLGKDKYK